MIQALQVMDDAYPLSEPPLYTMLWSAVGIWEITAHSDLGPTWKMERGDPESPSLRNGRSSESSPDH